MFSLQTVIISGQDFLIVDTLKMNTLYIVSKMLVSEIDTVEVIKTKNESRYPIIRNKHI